MDHLLALFLAERSSLHVIISWDRRLSSPWTIPSFISSRGVEADWTVLPLGTESKEHRDKCSGKNEQIRIEPDLTKTAFHTYSFKFDSARKKHGLTFTGCLHVSSGVRIRWVGFWILHDTSKSYRWICFINFCESTFFSCSRLVLLRILYVVTDTVIWSHVLFVHKPQK
jgi:hypothetical protein